MSGEHPSLERRSKISCHRVKLRLPENVERPMEISRRSHTLTVMKCTKQCDVLAELLFYLLNPLILFLSVSCRRCRRC